MTFCSVICLTIQPQIYSQFLLHLLHAYKVVEMHSIYA